MIHITKNMINDINIIKNFNTFYMMIIIYEYEAYDEPRLYVYVC